MTALSQAELEAIYFDGVVSAERAVHLRISDGELLITGEGVRRAIILTHVRWPERARHGLRIVHFD